MVTLLIQLVRDPIAFALRRNRLRGSRRGGAVGGWRAILGFIQQWQVLLALAVGISGLWFNVNEQRRKELDVNRNAVASARSEQVRADFLADPRNTLAEFEVTYPGHAFCAALGFFIAEAGRESRRSDAAARNRLNEMNDAVLVEIEALAARIGLSSEDFHSFVRDSEASAAPPDGDPRCAQIAIDASPVANPLFETECRLAIESFGQNRCNDRRWSNQRAKTLRAEQEAITRYQRPAYYPTGSVEAPADDLPSSEATVPPAPPAAPFAYPEDVCGAVSPLIFTQYLGAGDEGTVEDLRRRMLTGGWQAMPAERVAHGATAGDVRIYDDAQRPCGEALADALGEVLGTGTPLQVISLQESYRGLPQNQMEIWLPELN